jgi:hypothetical protein
MRAEPKAPQRSPNVRMELVERRGERGSCPYRPTELKNQSPQFLSPPATPHGLAQAKVMTLRMPISIPPVMVGQFSKKRVLYPLFRISDSTLLSVRSFMITP